MRAAIIEQMVQRCFLGHREVRRWEVVGLVDDENAVASLGNVLGRHTTATTRTDNDYIRLDVLNARPGFKLDEAEVVALNRLPFPWSIVVADGLMKEGAGNGNCFVHQ